MERTGSRVRLTDLRHKQIKLAALQSLVTAMLTRCDTMCRTVADTCNILSPAADFILPSNR